MNILSLVKRKKLLFAEDMQNFAGELSETLKKTRILVIGGGGTIGQATVKEICKYEPKAIHVVDLSENNLVELIRDLRSSLGAYNIDLQTFAIDSNSQEFTQLIKSEKNYDYVFNLSALKHVRNEQNTYTLMRMLNVNIFNSLKMAQISKLLGAKKYFCVSTDKASAPINLMGASKRIMEFFLLRESNEQTISMARFANVAFSDGSLLHGFFQRINKLQPISAPFDILRYFLTTEEAGQLCLMSSVLGKNRDIFFPKLNQDLNMTTFTEIARSFIRQMGYEPFVCETEQEAREQINELRSKKKWPCYFFDSDTTGEKQYEEFFEKEEDVDFNKFSDIGVITNTFKVDLKNLEDFEINYKKLRLKESWNKKEILELIDLVLPNFKHHETGKYLNQRM